MENISNVLFWISNGLLVPVIVGLLYFFIRALFLLGGVYGEYLERKKTERDLNEKLENMAEEEVYGFGENATDSFCLYRPEVVG